MSSICRIALALGVLVAGCTQQPTALVAPPDSGERDADCNAFPERCPGGCRADSDCTDGANPRCDTSNHSCVACLPQPDNCAAGQVCQRVSGVWTCTTSCSANNDCGKLGGGGSLCCSGFCVNPASDVSHCGACSTACSAVNNGSPGCIEGRCVIASCNVGFEDCDKAILNGCETTVSNDAANCGKCGNACKPFSNGLPTCINGTCGSVCAPGYDDCDHVLMSGCEIDTTIDVANCGGCGKTCGAPGNALPACDQARCSYRCKLGFSDCDGNPGNGCEVDANKDSNNCGHCGNICPLRPNAMGAGCTNGQCTNTCAQGFGDCDNNAFNGCEANFSTSLAACGGCGKLCSNNNAVATCQGGMCTLQCKPGYMDCNNDPIDGCESQLLFDAKNCGACGMACPQNAAFCINGVCGQINTKVLIVYSSSYEADVKAKIVGSGAFLQVDDFAANGGTPTLQQLQPYGSCLVYSDSGFANPAGLGDVMADYFDQGGYVVVATFANASVPISGRWVSGGYLLIQQAGQEQPNDALGVIAEPNSPLVRDFKMLTATAAYRSIGGVINGGIVVASWNSGKPLIVRGVVKGKNVVTINAYPPSNGVRADFLTGDVGPLLRNALLFR